MSTRAIAVKARLLARSGTLRREQIGLMSFLASDQIGDELARRGREGHAVSGESAIHEHAVVEPPDVRQSVVRKAHRACPAVRHPRLRTPLVKEVLELFLDPRARS